MEVTRAIKSTSKIKSIKSVGRGPSYDLTVKDTHRILANGFYTSNCNHPEIETFIHIKRDRTRVTGANISIKLCDEFMEAVDKDTDFTLQWPVDVPLDQAKVSKVVRARDIWEQFIDAGWDAAEPGGLFWDAAEKLTPSEIYESFGYKSVSTNPCLTGDTLIAVADGRGMISIQELANAAKDVPVYTCDNKGKIVIRTMRNPRCTGHKVPVMKVTIEGGYSFKATPNHKIPLLDGKIVEVKDLLPGDQLQIMNRLEKNVVELNPNAKTKNKGRYIALQNQKETRTQQSIVSAMSQGYDVQINGNDVKVKRLCEYCKKEFYVSFSSREVSFCSFSCSNRYVNENSDANVRRTTTLNKVHSRKAEISRKRQLDIFTKLRFELKREPLQSEWTNACKQANCSMRLKTKYGFQSWDDLKQHARLHNHRVVSVENCGVEDVYNGTVDEFHSFYLGGWLTENFEHLFIKSLNCGEIILSEFDSCRLLAIDLTHFVDDAFTDNPTFNFEKFDECAQIGQRLLDDIVDLEIEAVDKIIEKIKLDQESDHVKAIELDLWERIKKAGSNGRRTGLGPTGLGDALAMLNVRYGSEESIEWTDKIYRALALASYRSSVKMAEERGPFAVYDYELEHQHPFIQRIMSQDSELSERYKKFGRRNIANTTTAPVGSLSTLTQTTSGIEPAFMLSYTRRKKQNPNDIDSKVDFVDAMGDKWTNHTVYHHAFKQWMDVTGKTDVKDSPYHKALSNDIDWMMTVKLQATAQKWICHSISKTVNLPQNASHDLVSQVYLEAWKSGCKGITVYRDKSRDGVLVSDDGKVQIDIPGRYDAVPDAEIEKMLGIGEKYFRNMPSGYKTTLKQIKEYYESRKNPKPVQERSIIEENHALKRHKELPCDIKQVKIAGESWTILVGLLNGKPYEVFGGLSSLVEVSKKIKHGILVKNGKKDGITSYNLKITVGEDDFVFKDIVQLFDNPTQGALTRMLSLLLRHNVPVQYIVEQLQKDKYSDMTSFARVIARVLKAYIPDGVKSTSEKKCDVCGAEGTLIYQEGCVKCSACGNSRCG